MPAATNSSVATKLLTVGLASMAAAAVLAIGAVHAATQVVLSGATLLLFCGYVVVRGRRGVRPIPFAGVAAVALAITAAQLLPLPAALVRLISPRSYELQREAGVAGFMPLSLDSAATWLALARGAACTALLLVAGGLVRSTRHAARLMWIPAAIGAGLGAIALAERAVGAHAILGFYVPRSTPGFGFFGTFVDVNHAASVLALGCLAAIGLAVELDGRRSLAVACATLSAAALMMTSSRGGMAAFAIAAYLFVTILVARSSGLLRAGVLATVLLLVGATVLLATNEGLRGRFVGPTAELWSNQKTRGWAEGMRMAADFPLSGVGRGAFAAPIDHYRHVEEGVRLVYPEDVVVQMASEWGLAATLVLLALVLLAVRRVARPLAAQSPALLAGSCGVLAVVTHELFDFGLEFPGVAFVTAVTLGIVVGAVTRQGRQQPRVRAGFRLGAIAPAVAAWLVVLCGAAWAARHTLDDDYERLQAAAAAGAIDPQQMSAAIARHPADGYLELIAARDAMRSRPAEAMRHLNRALDLQPASWQAHRLAARVLVAAERPAQAALEYRLATAAGFVADPHELAKALGDSVVQAVPQTPSDLHELARKLYGAGEPRLADRAAAAAVDVSELREPALVARVQLAQQFAAPRLADAARALVAEARSVDSFAVAAEALAKAHDRAGAEAALAAGKKEHPADGALLLVGARIALDVGDAAAARSLLGRGAAVPLTLEQRQKAEELLAEAAERTGDPELAVRARARAQLIAHQLRDMSMAENNGTHP